MRAGEGILISTYKQEQAKDLSEVAKNQQTDPLSLLENLQGYLKNLESEGQSKAATFKQAIMLLASSSSIAIESNEDIHLSADGQINQIAQGSINTSMQDSIIGHASKKISLFAAQEGVRLYAGKGKIEIQAQGDGADLIARKGVQIISTEANVDITSAKEIVLTAGGSQLKINASGIFPTTASKFEVKAGQHQFMGGAKVPLNFPLMPNEIRKQIAIKYHDDEPVKGANFKMKYANGQTFSGVNNDDGIADIRDAPDGEAEIIFGEDTRSYQVVAQAEENTNFKAEWDIADLEKSYQQALKDSKK